MRTDATIDGRAVICPRSSMIGYSTVTCRVGSFFVYGEEDFGDRIMARMIGRIKHAPQLEHNDKPIRNWILALVLSRGAHSLYERWVDPEHVRECYDLPPTALAAFFFQPKIGYDAQTLRRLAEHGTLQDQFVSQVAERVEMFKTRDMQAKANPLAG